MKQDMTAEFTKELLEESQRALDLYLCEIRKILPNENIRQLKSFASHFSGRIEMLKVKQENKPQPHKEVKREIVSLKNKIASLTKSIDLQRNIYGYNTLNVLVANSSLSVNDSFTLLEDLSKLLNQFNDEMLEPSAGKLLKSESELTLYPSKFIKQNQVQFACNVQRLLKDCFDITATTAEKEPFAQLVRLGFRAAGCSIDRIHDVLSEAIKLQKSL